MKQLLPLLILINCHVIQVSGFLEWTVTGKVTDFGQNVTLFCHVPNCCPKDAGWDRWTPVQQTLFIDVKTGRPNKKYDGKAEKDGYTLVIQNLTKEDLNVSYSCLYDVTIGQSKFLLEEDVFTDKSDTTPNDRLSEIQIAGLIIGIVVPVAVAVVFFVILLLKKRKTNHTRKVDEPLLSKEIPSKDERNTYMDAVQSGTENRQYVRIQVIGKDRVGKTCLVRRLLGKPIKDVVSTDGIDIDKTCQIRTRDGEWIVGEIETERREMIRRLQQAFDIKHEETKPTSQLSRQEQEQKRNTQKLNLAKDKSMETNKRQKEPRQQKKHSIEQDKKENNLEPTESDNLIVSPALKSNSDDENVKSVDKRSSFGEKDTPSPNQRKRASFLSLQNQNDETTDKITKAVIDEMDAIIVDTKNQKEKMKLEGLVKCGIWDFAGQKDYYATHQTFFTPNAIYLLVADITKDLKYFNQDEELDSTKDKTEDKKSCKQDMRFDSIEDYIDFWFDCIHCLCEDDLDHANTLCPPVIMVCTGTDKYKKDVDAANRIEIYKKKFQKIVNEERKFDHKRGVIFFVSNKKKGNEEIKKLRSYISDIANEMNYFVEKLPTKWIYLENALSVLKGLGENVYEWRNILKLAQKNLIEEDELLRFLKYQHKIGNIIFFDELKEYIILQPFWLVQCFRCLVDDCSPEKRNYALSLTARQALQSTGELTDKSIDILFKKEATLQFRKHKLHLLNVMKKFDIIVQPEFCDIDNNKRHKSHSYYLPCMIEKSLPFDTIKKMFLQGNDQVTTTPWLVLEFKFLPLAYFNHILIYFLQNYTVCKEKTTGHPAVYRGKAVFYLDHGKLSKLIICFSRNAISLQIWKWRGEDDDVLYKRMFNKLCDKTESIRRTIGRNISYHIKAKCSTGDFENCIGRIRYEDLTDKEDFYMCEEHNDTHRKTDIVKTWLKHDYDRKKEKEAEQDEKTREEEESAKAKTQTCSTVKDDEENILERKKHLHQMILNNQFVKHYYARVMFIGKNGVGKTSLMRRLLGLGKHAAFNTESTDGVSISKCMINVQNGKWRPCDKTDDDLARLIKHVFAENKDKTKDNVAHKTKSNNTKREMMKDVADHQEKEQPEKSDLIKTPTKNMSSSIALNVDVNVDEKTKEDNYEATNQTNQEAAVQDDINSKIYLHSEDQFDVNHTKELQRKELDNIDNEVNDSVSITSNSSTVLNEKCNITVDEDLCQTTRNDDLKKMTSDIIDKYVQNSDANQPQKQEGFASCWLWDFAGQNDFYATHQAFLSSCAVYILVADSLEFSAKEELWIDFKKSAQYVRFWCDAVHCYCQTTDNEDMLDPAIVIVHTKKDAHKEKSIQEDHHNAFVKNIGNVLLGQDQKKHIRDTLNVSNTEDGDDVFEHIRKSISALASEMESWGVEIPLKWFLFQQVIEKLKENKVPISTTKKVQQMASHKDIGITDDDDFRECLLYFHDVGTIIYYDEEGLNENVILDPKWLIDAFRCLVSHQISNETKIGDDWCTLQETGKITTSLLSKLLQKKTDYAIDFHEHKDHLIEVMKKFDIIVNMIDSRDLYMPCMMKDCSLDFVKRNFITDTSDKTSWLCLRFDFLPPVFFNHIIAGYMKIYRVSSSMDTEKGDSIHALYRKIAVFDLPNSRCKQLILCQAPNILAVQIWFSKGDHTKEYRKYRKDLDKYVQNLKSRYKLNIMYKVEFACKDGGIEVDRTNLCDLNEPEYRCKYHNRNIHSSGELLNWWYTKDESENERQKQLKEQRE